MRFSDNYRNLKAECYLLKVKLFRVFYFIYFKYVDKGKNKSTK